MQATTAIYTGVFLAVAVVLILAAIEDIKTRQIANRLSLILVGLFGVTVAADLLTGADVMAAIVWPAVVGSSVFLVGLALFATGVMGGGDVKLLSAVALFAGPDLGLSFVLYVAVIGGFVAIALLAWSRWRKDQSEQSAKVPYGVAISAGGLWVCFHQISALSI
ncbi:MULTISPECIES: A24 family peptidase [Kordiimonas]|jgi:prepilin peptidase CpaA|uniref:A24 family peptidase n=1 Tax=Kordiimonas TaxID=288021 RepID=UPI00257CE1E7|nr:prepilin peptidase [Kordiimonas sp. UBA4487]